MSKGFFETATYNTVLYESKNFIVIPSLGALVSGWVLIIPKNHYLNLSQLDSEKLTELDLLSTTVENIIARKFGCDVVMFEHGPKSMLSKVGCGVDYAHLHILPIKVDLIDGLHDFLNIQYHWDKIDSIKSLKRYSDCDNDYLYYRNQSNENFITQQEVIPSQLFRRVIASSLNKPNNFDWKNFPEMNLVEETIKDFSQKEFA